MTASHPLGDRINSSHCTKGPKIKLSKTKRMNEITLPETRWLWAQGGKVGTHPGLPHKGRAPSPGRVFLGGTSEIRGKSVTPTSELNLQVRGQRQSLPNPREGVKSSIRFSVRGHAVTCCHTFLTHQGLVKPKPTIRKVLRVSGRSAYKPITPRLYDDCRLSCHRGPARHWPKWHLPPMPTVCL